MGTGPFTFVEHVKGSHWVGQRNPAYWDRDRPYLDGYRALFIRDDAAQALAISSGRAHIQFRGFSPAQREEIVRALGDKVTVQESAWNCGLVVAINHEHAPFHDRRVRRALSLALDRYQAADVLSKVAIVREVAGVQVPRTPFATPPAELVKLAGYWRNIQESRTEARRLLAAAEIAEGTSFVLKNRNIPMPYAHVGTWLVDQWRQIGLTVRQEIQDSGQYFKDLRAGNFELSTDFQCGYVVDPDLDLHKFQSRDRSDANYGRYTDPSWTTCTSARVARWIPSNAGSTCARSRSAFSTRKHTTSTRSSGTGSCRTARACAAGRSRPATTSTTSSTQCGLRSSGTTGCYTDDGPMLR